MELPREVLVTGAGRKVKTMPCVAQDERKAQVVVPCEAWAADRMRPKLRVRLARTRRKPLRARLPFSAATRLGG